MEQISGPFGQFPGPRGHSPEVDHLAPPSILLVEDDFDIREMVATLLSFAGFQVEAHGEAESALDALREGQFDLVLTDYALPRRTGIWLLEQARAEGLLDGVPTMIVTAHPQVEGGGQYEIIQKPFDLDDLINRVRQRMEGGNVARPKKSVPRLPATSDGDDGSGMHECPEPVELILYISRMSPRSFAALRNVKAALARFDPSRVRLTVHDLSEDPSQGVEDAVAFTPTLVRRTPGPRTFILGHISNPELVLQLLADCEEPGVN